MLVREEEDGVVLMPREFFPSFSLFPPRALGGRSLSGRPPHGAQRSVGSGPSRILLAALLLPSLLPLLDLNSDEMTP